MLVLFNLGDQSLGGPILCGLYKYYQETEYSPVKGVPNYIQQAIMSIIYAHDCHDNGCLLSSYY